MQTNPITPLPKAEQLTDAFRIFNELSENLSASYQNLEKQVAKLHAELSAARSERVKTLIEKEKLATRLQQILGALPAAVLILDQEGVVIDYNSKAEIVLNGQLLGKTWTGIKEECFLKSSENPHECQLLSGNRVTISLTPFDPETGQIVMLSDVTEMRALEEQLNQQQKLIAMGEMVASLAHQIRTPLSAAVLYVSQLTKPVLEDEKRQRFASKIHERLLFLERQLNDMLIFAKQGRLTMEKFSLPELLNKINETVTDRLVNTSIQFKLVDTSNVDMVTGNENALRGAILNLINNAIDVCLDQGVIELRVQSLDVDQFVISVKDNGPGIAQKNLSKIFEPFYTTKSSGNGLGLAVVDSIVRAHGGSVSCCSKPDEGSIFELTIPYRSGELEILPGGYSSKAETIEEGDDELL